MVGDAFAQRGARRGAHEPLVRPPLARSLAQELATKKAASPLSAQAVSGAEVVKVEATDPREIAMSMLADYGWDQGQFACLDPLWVKESNWNPSASNASSGAYGIPQSLPGSKMASAGSDYLTNPATQIEWGLGYIRDSYGSPCGAWSFSQANNWY